MHKGLEEDAATLGGHRGSESDSTGSEGAASGNSGEALLPKSSHRHKHKKRSDTSSQTAPNGKGDHAASAQELRAGSRNRGRNSSDSTHQYQAIGSGIETDGVLLVTNTQDIDAYLKKEEAQRSNSLNCAYWTVQIFAFYGTLVGYLIQNCASVQKAAHPTEAGGMNGTSISNGTHRVLPDTLSDSDWAALFTVPSEVSNLLLTFLSIQIVFSLEGGLLPLLQKMNRMSPAAKNTAYGLMAVSALFGLGAALPTFAALLNGRELAYTLIGLAADFSSRWYENILFYVANISLLGVNGLPFNALSLATIGIGGIEKIARSTGLGMSAESRKNAELAALSQKFIEDLPSLLAAKDTRFIEVRLQTLQTACTTLQKTPTTNEEAFLLALLNKASLSHYGSLGISALEYFWNSRFNPWENIKRILFSAAGAASSVGVYIATSKEVVDLFEHWGMNSGGAAFLGNLMNIAMAAFCFQWGRKGFEAIFADLNPLRILSTLVILGFVALTLAPTVFQAGGFQLNFVVLASMLNSEVINFIGNSDLVKKVSAYFLKKPEEQQIDQLISLLKMARKMALEALDKKAAPDEKTALIESQEELKEAVKKETLVYLASSITPVLSHLEKASTPTSSSTALCWGPRATAPQLYDAEKIGADSKSDGGRSAGSRGTAGQSGFGFA